MLNNVNIQGRLVADPELRRTQNNTAVTSFTLACDRDIKSKSTGERGTDFIDCTAWSNTAEFVSKYFKKGQMMIAAGRIELEQWTTKDGSKRNSHKVNVSSVYFCESKKDDTTTANHYSQSDIRNAAAEIEEMAKEFSFVNEQDPDLPF